MRATIGAWIGEQRPLFDAANSRSATRFVNETDRGVADLGLLASVASP